jgi:hypothetical protein
VEGVAKAHNGRCVHSLGVDSWILDESEIGPVDKGIGIDEKQFVHTN